MKGDVTYPDAAQWQTGVTGPLCTSMSLLLVDLLSHAGSMATVSRRSMESGRSKRCWYEAFLRLAIHQVDIME